MITLFKFIKHIKNRFHMLNKFDKHDYAIQIRNILNSKHSKSQLLASISSSILPGSGQLYTHHYREGFFSIIVNSLFGYLFYDSYRNGTSSDKIFRGFLFLQFYSANILAGKRSAIVYNEINNDKLVSNISSYIDLDMNFPLLKINDKYYIKIF